MTSLTASQQQAISAAIKQSKDGVKRALHPANPGDAAAIAAFLELSGKTEKTHPGLYADIGKLAGGKPDGDNASQVLDIVDSGRDVHGRATARVWHLDQQGSFMSGSLALVLCAKSGKPLALGYANKVGGGLAPAATRAASAQPATEAITTVGFYHSQASADATPQFGMVMKAQDGLTQTELPCTVNAPKTTNTTKANVQIGLGRPNPANDLDYFYKQDTADQPPLLVPFEGNVNVQQPLANVASNGQFTSGLKLETKLYSITGASYSYHDTNQTINTQVTGNTQTNLVTWTYPFDPARTKPSDTPSLIYQALAASRDTLTAFYFSFGIPVNNPVKPNVPFTVCSTDWPDPPSQDCKQIQPLQFWWHCLAEGTNVTLADGTTRAIEHVDNTMRVRTGNGAGTLGVEATTRGTHLSGATPASKVYKLTTKKGRTLLLTGGHPVMTEDGLMAACDLAPGMALIGEDGGDAVATCAVDSHDGVFCNLKLGDDKDRAKGLHGAVGTFIANGIMVGDFDSMEQAHYARTHSLDYMRARLPERYHVDYASTLAAIAHDNVKYGGNF